jgi:hypothetical protein
MTMPGYATLTSPYQHSWFLRLWMRFIVNLDELLN